MQIPQSFFFRVIKPGRYIGGETGELRPGGGADCRPVAWCYPGRYEAAMGDPGFRRGFHALNALDNITCVRCTDYASDLWQMLHTQGMPPFALDAHWDLREIQDIVFWIPDVFAGGHIPSLLHRLRQHGVNGRIGAVVNGAWAPNFLRQQVDWVVSAPHGWLPACIGEIVRGGDIPAQPGVYARDKDNWGDLSAARATDTVLAHGSDTTRQWVPLVEAGTGLADLDLLGADTDGTLRVRPVPELVHDALQALRETGLEGLRLCDDGVVTAATIPTTLIELTRVFNMARLQLALPPVTVADFDHFWRSYKPHLTKPVLPLRLTPADDVARLVATGRDALNAGWHGLTLVLTFASYADFSTVVAQAEEITRGWLKAASGFDDRRPVRVEYDPATIAHWNDPPSEPSEVDFRRLSHECRHFRESVSNQVAVPGPHIEEIIARNWLAAAGLEIWDSLAALDLSDPNDDATPAHNWIAWLRQRSGMPGPPTETFTRGSVPAVAAPTAADAPSTLPTPVAVESPGSSQMYGRRKKRPVFSRRLQAPSFTRLRLQWGKSAAWRLYSHLDCVRAIERTIRKSAIPVQYSEGFHPRMKISFGPPLSFGLTSRAELLDILLDRGVEDGDIVALKDAFPDGLFVVDATGFPSQVPSLTETINEAEYAAIIPLPPEIAQGSIQEFLSRPAIQWVRPDRPDRKPIDPRNTLRSMEMEVTPEGTRWTLCVTVGGPGGARPLDWAGLVFQFNDDQLAALVIERTALRVRQNETARSPLETAPV